MLAVNMKVEGNRATTFSREIRPNVFRIPVLQLYDFANTESHSAFLCVLSKYIVLRLCEFYNRLLGF